MAQVMFYRYVDDTELRAISTEHLIEPGPAQVCKWYTPDRYDTGAEAQRFLALPYEPTHRIGPFPSEYLPDFDHAQLRPVSPAHSQPGGGLEGATTKVMYLFEIAHIT